MKAREAGNAAARRNASQQALQLREKLAQADPQNKRLRADLAASQHAFALILLDAGKADEARKHLEQAVALREALAQEETNNAQYQSDVTASRFALGNFFWQTGRLTEAVAIWQRELDKLEEAARVEKSKAFAVGQLVTLRRTIAEAYAWAGLWPEATAVYDRLLAGPDLTDKDYLRAACVALRAGDNRIYRQSCDALAARLGDNSAVDRYPALAWMHALADKTVSEPAQPEGRPAPARCVRRLTGSRPPTHRAETPRGGRGDFGETPAPAGRR